ncbi:MAG TPA: hypothetical protein VK484_11665 [Ferruginibacter sp.]|nr:hypothetical protein [Ferruginibacter sp.]
MKKIFLLYLTCLLASISHSYSQNIGIGTTTPNSSAMLDVQSTNKGMLVPRIALTSANAASPVTSPADALLIYNTATAGSGINAVIPGFYYWSVSANRWSPISPTVSTVNPGYGSWADCSGNSVSEYHPFADENSYSFGVSVSISGNYAIIGDNKDGDKGSASFYQFNGTNWVFMQKVTDATGDFGDWFGVSVSISGNYAIVGAVYDDNGATSNQGSASIFQYNGTNWVLMQKIVPAGGTNDYFGVSVSISGNYAAVGRYGADLGNGPFQGAVHIYQYNGSSWASMQQITDATGAAGDSFGDDVSISGNYVIVGASLDDFGVNANQGSASIFQYNGSNWVLMQKITDATGTANDWFGASVSISGNYAIIGAMNDDVGVNADQGSANIYRYTGTTWELMQKITDPNGSADDLLGYDVFISGNYIIMGCFRDDIGSNSNQGSATIYVRVGAAWQKLQNLVDPGGSENEQFGLRSAIDGTSKRFLITGNGPLNRGKVVFGKIN